MQSHSPWGKVKRQKTQNGAGERKPFTPTSSLGFSFSVGGNTAQVVHGDLMTIFSPKLTKKTPFTNGLQKRCFLKTLLPGSSPMSDLQAKSLDREAGAIQGDRGELPSIWIHDMTEAPT